jgi:hypothetical protein
MGDIQDVIDAVVVVDPVDDPIRCSPRPVAARQWPNNGLPNR